MLGSYESLHIACFIGRLEIEKNINEQAQQNIAGTIRTQKKAKKKRSLLGLFVTSR